MELTARFAAPRRSAHTNTGPRKAPRFFRIIFRISGTLILLFIANASHAQTNTDLTLPTVRASTAASAGVGKGKDLTGRWGLGIANIGPGQTPTLSVDWNLTQASGFQFDLGMDTSKDNSLFEISARFNRSLFIEDHQLYMLYFGGGLISSQVNGENSSGYVLEAGPAARFFFPGLPNLGFLLGGGIRLESLGGVRFRTVVNGGMHYYF